MTLAQKKLLKDFMFGLISHEEMQKKYPVDLTKNGDYIFSTIRQAWEDKNPEDLEYSLLLILFNKAVIYQEGFVELLGQLLKEEWHHQQEDIVSVLQKLKSPKSIEVLYETIFKKFTNLSYDDTYSLSRQCIHALGDINTDESRAKLKLLTVSDIPAIKEAALKQLSNTGG
jgi:hypothetical protein